MDTPGRRVWWRKEAQRQGDFSNNSRICIYTPQNIYMGHVRVFDKYLHWPPVSVTVNIYIHPATG